MALEPVAFTVIACVPVPAPDVQLKDCPAGTFTCPKVTPAGGVPTGLPVMSMTGGAYFAPKSYCLRLPDKKHLLYQ
jgi:hypothetical protein